MKNLLWWIHGTKCLPESREGIEPFSAPERETWLGRIGLPSLAVVGLLCHLLLDTEADLYDRSWLDGTRLMILLLFFVGSSVCSVLLGSLVRRGRTKLR